MLNREDLTENIVIIKINRLYHEGMNENELYEATRGVWKRNIESVSKADYCLAVAKGMVVEVYKIENWYPAGTIPMTTRSIEPDRIEGRIEFVGILAEERIREKYIGKSVANLYKHGEADPVKVFLKDAIGKQISNDINEEIAPLQLIATEDVPVVICPRCEKSFSKALRCPECGQLIKYENEMWNKLISSSYEE